MDESRNAKLCSGTDYRSADIAAGTYAYIRLEFLNDLSGVPACVNCFFDSNDVFP